MSRVVTLSGGSPWGFRLVGGFDFRASLAISKVTPGGKADRAGIKPGDVILEINNTDTTRLSHLEAQNQVKSSTATLLLKIESGGTGQREASVTLTPSPSVQSNATSYPSKPSTFTTSAGAAPTQKSWQAVRPTPPPPAAAAPASHVSNDDFLPPPPPIESLQQQTQAMRVKDDFPAPPPMSEPKTTTPQIDPKGKLICEGCKQEIKGSYLDVKGKPWHPEEFVCSSPSCGKSLQNTGYVEDKGKRFCSDCYEKFHARVCAKCNLKIVGQVMHALDQTWHVVCFVCVECRKPFQGGVFQMENNKPYCVDDYKRIFSTTCKNCNRSIEGGEHYVEAINAKWHSKCFYCAVCKIELKDARFFAVSGKPVCSNHRNAQLPA